MPPGFPPGNYCRWDDLCVWSQAQLIGYYQTAEHYENPPIKKGKLP
ncbi:MAG: hypothetical protein ACYSW8_27855 [Planctomycetota bacterium]|jgi:hypothetical protein